MSDPLISICIPAYKRVDYLKRLLDSIAMQSFDNFEVVMTDDSGDDSVRDLVHQYRFKSLQYQKNVPALGTPENWNAAVRLARAPWIKIMHDDDWFVSAGALAAFAAATRDNAGFIFAAYNNIYEKTGKTALVSANRWERYIVRRNPAVLMGKNIIGPPSVTLYRRNALEYDRRMKWRVDIDFYIHYLKENPRYHYINQPLVNIGIGAEQVTRSAFRVPEVEIPENFLLLKKTGTAPLRNWYAYDAWWRLFRNLAIRQVSGIRQAGYTGPVPPVIEGILADQRKVPAGWLHAGVISKILMTRSYLRRRPERST